MGFHTKWEQKDAAGEISKIIKENGDGRMRSIADFVDSETDRRGNHTISAESNSGIFHDTKVDVKFRDDPQKGCYIEVIPKPGSDTSYKEAQEIENKIKEAYFGDGVVR